MMMKIDLHKTAYVLGGLPNGLNLAARLNPCDYVPAEVLASAVTMERREKLSSLAALNTKPLE